MTDNTGSYPPRYGDPQTQSTTDVAKEQAANVGQSVSGAGSHVAQTAADQAKQVAAETARQARDLMGEATGQARDQASVQQQRAAQQLHSVAGELDEMAAKGGQSGLATEVAQQAAERLHGAASWLEQREPADLLTSVRDFARRRPVAFLAGAAIAGLAVGRLTRGMTAAARSDDEPAQPQGTRQITSTGTPALAEPAWTDPVYQGGTAQGTTVGTAAGLPAEGVAYPEGSAYPEDVAPGVPGYVAGSYPEDGTGAYPGSAGYPQGPLDPDGAGATSEDEPRRP